MSDHREVVTDRLQVVMKSKVFANCSTLKNDILRIEPQVSIQRHLKMSADLGYFVESKQGLSPDPAIGTVFTYFQRNNQFIDKRQLAFGFFKPFEKGDLSFTVSCHARVCLKKWLICVPIKYLFPTVGIRRLMVDLSILALSLGFYLQFRLMYFEQVLYLLSKDQLRFLLPILQKHEG